MVNFALGKVLLLLIEIRNIKWDIKTKYKTEILNEKNVHFNNSGKEN